MFFAASKILWALFQPSSLLTAMIAGGALLWNGMQQATGRRLVMCGIALLFVLGLSPLGGVITLPLEERFPRPTLTEADDITGIVVLGGGQDPHVGSSRDVLSLNEAGERMVEAVTLSRKYPKAKVVFTGGSAELMSANPPEVIGAKQFFLEMGVAPERLIMEAQSRNTFENALFTRDLVKPKAGARWLLVTSAFHMPRAMGCFRKAGFAVEPFPVDYRTSGFDEIYRPFSSIPEGLRSVDFVFKEYVGLFVYYLTGRTDTLFPGP